MNAVMPSQIELRIPRSCEFVRVARKTAGALAHGLQFTLHEVADIELAVSEACTNAVEHVSEQCPEILVRFSVEAEQLVMEVIDRGPGFDPTRPPESSLEDEDGVGGLGLLVIRALMDELEIKCGPDEGGTRVRMVKYRKKL
jgi:anti-sigma regulatory factor (Ser/Thr protein kinase)